jgi:hypothetical protein
MNEQQTKELAKQYQDRAAIMEASEWVDGLCVNVQVRPLHGDSQCWKYTDGPVWDFKNYEYRIVEPDEVRYHAWRNDCAVINIGFATLENVSKFCEKQSCTHILKVTTKPDGTKDAEFIEVGK